MRVLLVVVFREHPGLLQRPALDARLLLRPQLFAGAAVEAQPGLAQAVRLQRAAARLAREHVEDRAVEIGAGRAVYIRFIISDDYENAVFFLYLS
mgnify:CR=1 FL=1